MKFKNVENCFKINLYITVRDLVGQPFAYNL